MSVHMEERNSLRSALFSCCFCPYITAFSGVFCPRAVGCCGRQGAGDPPRETPPKAIKKRTLPNHYNQSHRGFAFCKERGQLILG